MNNQVNKFLLYLLPTKGHESLCCLENATSRATLVMTRVVDVSIAASLVRQNFFQKWVLGFIL